MTTSKKAAGIRTQKELLAKLNGLGKLTQKQRRSVACSLIGHSRIQTHFFGYFYCGRCGVEVGDKLGSIYNTLQVVIVGHGCDTCRKNYEACTWKDRLMVPNPFKEPAP